MIVTFFSYKGGSGRSLSMANVAALLAGQGRNVGLIDLDLDSPGLHHIFRVTPKRNKSLIDILLGGFVPGLEGVTIDLRQHLTESGHSGLRGALWLVPTVAEIRKLARLQWDEGTFDVFNELVEHFIRVFQLDHLFIDARTGYSAAASNAFSVSDGVVCVLRLNDQSVSGVLQLVEGFEGVGKPYILVASSVPNSSRADGYLQRYQEKLGGRQFSVVVPYDEDLAFEERLLGLESPKSGYARAMQALSARIEGEING